MSCEVLIVGGGPAGSVCASRLAQHGRSVVLLEKESFPRFHLGESLLPNSLETLEDIGVLEKLKGRFLEKHGARFHDESGETIVRFAFANALRGRFSHSFQVPRDEFDEVLLDHARSLGADARERWVVTKLRFDGTRAIGALATDPEGQEHSIDADFVVDASGRDALTARARRGTVKIPKLDKTALFSHFHHVPRAAGVEGGDIDILVAQEGWFWVIPFKDGRTSVGAVMSSAWMKTRRDGETVNDLFRRAVSESPAARKLLAGAEQLWPALAAADYSYRVEEVTGDGWLAIGDAGGFIDPLFSTGAHLGMHGGKLAADAIHQALDAGDVSKARFDTWKLSVGNATDLFVEAVRAFYSGSLVKYLFAANPKTYVRRAVTSMLSGDVFEDTRWNRELRARLGQL